MLQVSIILSTVYLKWRSKALLPWSLPEALPPALLPPIFPHPSLPFPGSWFLLTCSPHTSSYPDSTVPCRRSELNHTNWLLTDPHQSCSSSWINTTTWSPQSHRLEVSESRSPLRIPTEFIYYLGVKKWQLSSSPYSSLCRIHFTQLSSFSFLSFSLVFGSNIFHPAAIHSHLFWHLYHGWFYTPTDTFVIKTQPAHFTSLLSCRPLVNQHLLRVQNNTCFLFSRSFSLTSEGGLLINTT